MKLLENVIRWLTRITSWVALVTMSVMALFITVAAAARSFEHPIVGDIELVQLGMVVLIMFGLAFSQAEDAHISIGLIVDRLSPRIQLISDVLGAILTWMISWLVAWIFVGDALKNLFETVITTDLWSIPFYPFKFIIMTGFFLWGLEAFLKAVYSLVNLFTGNMTVVQKTDKGVEII